MQVLRLEHPSDGLGPYRWLHGARGGQLDWAQRDAMSITTNTGSSPMIGVDYPSHFKFGFANRRQAESWWCENARREAAAKGYALAVYEVPGTAVIHGDSQVAFDPEVAKLVAHIPASEWVTGNLNIPLAAEAEQCVQQTADSPQSEQNFAHEPQPKPSGMPSYFVSQGSVRGVSRCQGNVSQIPKDPARLRGFSFDAVVFMGDTFDLDVELAEKSFNELRSLYGGKTNSFRL